MLKFWFLFLFIMFINANADTIDYQINLNANKFKTIMETVVKNHYDSVDIKSSSDKAFETFMKSLDNQSQYYSQQDMTKINESNSGVSFGIGADVIKLTDTLYVGKIHDNSSSQKSGLKIGDKILFINGENIKDFSLLECQKKLSGSEKSKVNLIIKRQNELKEFNIERNNFPYKSIPLTFYIDSLKALYMKISRFSDLTFDEFNQEVNKFKKHKIESFILDLRGNPGGYLKVASQIADKFIPGDRVIVYTESKISENIVKEYSKNGDDLEGIPLVILMDEKSASGSEIIAGAIQDYDLGLVVGEQSFGKGSIQRLWTIGDGSGIRITLGYYHTPSGRIIQKGIIKNDEKVVLDKSIDLTLDSNTKDKLQEAINKFDGQKSLPVFKTEHGRNVFGGGGIFPDYFIKNDTTTLLTKILVQNGIFLEWSIKKIELLGDSLNKSFKTKDEFISKYKLTDALLQDFAKFAANKNVWNMAMYNQDKKLILNNMKSYLAYVLYGEEAFMQAQLQSDLCYLGSLNYIQNAKELLYKFYKRN